MMFFSVFGSTECDKIANTTAIGLTNAINKVALEYGVEPWTGEGVPTNDKTDNYVSVPIRLCEKNMMNSFAAQFTAQQPTYILTYEIFPEGGFAWSESQPFSGGAAESIFNYLLMTRGIQALTFASKYVVKAIRKVGGWIKSTVSYAVEGLLGIEISKWLEEVKNNRVIKWILKRLGSSAAQEPIEENVDDLVNDKLYKSENKGLLERFKQMWKGDDISQEKALVNIGAFKEGAEGLALRMPDGRIVVTQEGRSFIKNFIANMEGEEAEEFAAGLYIPPRFPWLSNKIERINANYWQPFKNRIKTWWQNRWIKKYLYDKPKNLYNRIKGKIEDAKTAFNEIFNYKDGMTNPEIMSEEIGVVTGIAKENNEEILQGMKKNFDKFKDELEDLYQGNKIFQTADDITSADVDLYIDSFEKWGNLQDLTKFTPREIPLIDQSSLAQRKMGNDLRTMAKQVKEGTLSYEDFKNLGGEWSIENAWEDLPRTQKDKLIERASAGYTHGGQPMLMEESEVKKAYEYTRMSMANEGLFDRTKMFVGYDPMTMTGGTLRVNQLVKKSERVERELLSSSYKMYSGYSTERIIGFLSTPLITSESSLDKIPRSAKVAATDVWQRVKRGVFLDLNRIGQTPVYSALNVLQSPYNIKQALKKESQIQEGGCASQSICKLQRGQATGPTETATAYLLDRKVPSSITVKLWRQNPSIGFGELGAADTRTPAGVNTGLLVATNSVTVNPRFYVVSPCFAVAKVWKDKSQDTVFISIDKGNKCDVSGCEQPGSAFNILNQQIGLSPIDTPNYCYADKEFIWGVDDSPSQLGYYGTFAGLTIACAAATAWYSGGAAWKACLKGVGYATIGILMADVVAATQAYRDVPSWKRQETGWGYWNYQKAADICDNIQMISSFGSFEKAGEKSTEAAKKSVSLLQRFKDFSKKSITDKLKIVGKKAWKATGISINDLCYGIQLMGDTSLAWPIKTPTGVFEVFRKAATLNDKCMQESAAKCVWLEKCDPFGADPSLIACPVGYTCDPEERICKKSSP